MSNLRYRSGVVLSQQSQFSDSLGRALLTVLHSCARSFCFSLLMNTSLSRRPCSWSCNCATHGKISSICLAQQSFFHLMLDKFRGHIRAFHPWLPHHFTCNLAQRFSKSINTLVKVNNVTIVGKELNWEVHWSVPDRSTSRQWVINDSLSSHHLSIRMPLTIYHVCLAVIFHRYVSPKHRFNTAEFIAKKLLLLCS